MSKEKKRYKNLSVRIAGQGREEFRAVAYLNGTTMSNLVHQWIVQAIYETKKERPEDFVVATGETHSVEELVETAFSYVDLDWRDFVVQDPKFMRPAEVDLLIGDPSYAREQLGWEPKVSFRELIQMMVDADLERHERERHLASRGSA